MRKKLKITELYMPTAFFGF